MGWTTAAAPEVMDEDSSAEEAPRQQLAVAPPRPQPTADSRARLDGTLSHCSFHVLLQQYRSLS